MVRCRSDNGWDSCSSLGESRVQRTVIRFGKPDALQQAVLLFRIAPLLERAEHVGAGQKAVDGAYRIDEVSLCDANEGAVNGIIAHSDSLGVACGDELKDGLLQFP